nr:T cell receptor alpha variable 24 [Myotis myotis]
MENNLLPALLLILWLHLVRVSSELNVEQSPPSLRVQEGKSTNFTCRFPTSSFYALHWYRWEPAKRPTILFVISLNGDVKKEGRVTAALNTTKGYSYLYIKGSQPEDSATYLCAFGTVLSRHLQPILKPGSGATLVPMLMKSHVWDEKGKFSELQCFQ